MPIVAFNNVWEMYRIKFVEDGKPEWENFWALKDVSFALEKGESLGIIGENGAGKSTVLKLIAGMIKPDRGAIEVSGKVSGLLELGAGFQSELTGKENVYLNASMFGLSRAETDAVYADIAGFADIGKFIHAPVKCYSQGMFVRLAFAIAVHVPSQILLIDDTLAVGDEHFQRKCLRKIFEFKEKGASVVFVTHDMHMLGRLCNRTLLLKEGRVLKDDAVERAVSLYTQTTGPREKVAHIEAGALALVCNEGRLFINWQGRLLTPGHGGHSAFLVAGAWLHSAQADWTVTRESDSVIVATGQFYQVPLRQVWRIELQEDRSIAWSIDLESPEGLKVQEGFVSIITGTEYAYWRTPCEKGEFGAFPQGASGWQDVLGREVSRKCLALVQGTDTPEAPVMAFELLKSSGKNSAQILNGDEYACGRMMRYRILSLSSGEPGEASREAFFSGRIRIAPADLNRYLAEREEHNFFSCGRLDVSFEAGGLKLSYAGEPLTQGTNMSTEMFVAQKRFYSALARWEIERPQPNKIIARGTWAGLSLTETWEVEAQDENHFTWRVLLDLAGDITVERRHAQVMCVPRYDAWFHRYGEGEFPKQFLAYDQDVLQRCLPGGIAGVASSAKLPALALEFEQKKDIFAKFFNSDTYARSRIVRIDRVAEEAARLSAGRQESFFLRVSLDPSRQSADARQSGSCARGALRCDFANGSGRIFFQDTELTKGLGLYASVRAQGRWFDSLSSAFWTVTRRDGVGLTFQGRWAELPLSQIWAVEIADEKTLNLRLTMQVAQEFAVERLQTSLMLSARYGHWQAKDKKGDFGDFRAGVDDDWETLYARAAAAGSTVACAGAGPLPSVTLRCLEDKPGHFLRVVNSDLYHQGRVLQCCLPEQTLFLPGEYPCFSGTVELGG